MGAAAVINTSELSRPSPTLNDRSKTSLLNIASLILIPKGGVSPLCSYSTLSNPLSMALKAKSFLSDSFILLIKPD